MTQQNEALIAQTFKQLLAKCNTNTYRIAKETGIDRTYLSKLSSSAIAKLGEDKLIKIARVLNIEPNQLATVFTDPEAAAQEFDLADINPTQPSTTIKMQDWGEAPDGIACYDRKAEIEQIKHWIEMERSRIVTFYGLGGMVIFSGNLKV